MLKRLWEKFASIKLLKSHFNFTISITIILAIILLCICIIQPFLTYIMAPQKEYRGIENYHNGSYKKFEKGKDFFDSFYSYDFAECCELIDFYYVDNSARDNLITGKMCDIYIIDLKVDLLYEEICQYIVKNGYVYIPDMNYEIYAMPTKYGKNTDCFYFAFNNNEQKIRYILITEIKDNIDSLGIKDIVTIIHRRSAYIW